MGLMVPKGLRWVYGFKWAWRLEQEAKGLNCKHESKSELEIS